jgi:hypothetical protein
MIDQSLLYAFFQSQCCQKSKNYKIFPWFTILQSVSVVVGFQRFNSKALLITLTELMAMAAPATTGFS